MPLIQYFLFSLFFALNFRSSLTLSDENLTNHDIATKLTLHILMNLNQRFRLIRLSYVSKTGRHINILSFFVSLD